MRITFQNVSLLAIALSFFLQGCSETIDARQTQGINGLIYKINGNEPFTGTVTNASASTVGYLISANCTIHFTKGELDGEAICKNQDGVKFIQSEWKSGKKNGVENTWVVNKEGKVTLTQDTHWKNGKLDGLRQVFNPYTGKLINKTNWSNGEKSGEEKAWDIGGDILLVNLEWVNGKQTGIQKLGEWEEQYVNGRLEGAKKRWSSETVAAVFLTNQQIASSIGAANFAGLYPGSFVATESIYKDGKQNGVQRSWRSPSQLWMEGSYENGERVGWHREWSTANTLVSEKYYTNDPVIRSETSYVGYCLFERRYDENGKLTEEACHSANKSACVVLMNEK